MTSTSSLLAEVRACRLCAPHLTHEPRPILQLDPRARILIAGQAPGRKTHEVGLPFADASGDRLRAWLGLSRETFYTQSIVAILPMGFCFPGTGKHGDLPPRPECAQTWREPLMARLKRVSLTLVLGQYAQAWHMPAAIDSVTDRVAAWEAHWPTIVPLPHPSPRNNGWLRRNPWFEADLLPVLQRRVAELVNERDRPDAKQENGPAAAMAAGHDAYCPQA